MRHFAVTDPEYDVSTLVVTVNGTAIKPEYYTSSTAISLVLRTQQAGSCRVEVKRPPNPQSVRVWNIAVTDGAVE